MSAFLVPTQWSSSLDYKIVFGLFSKMSGIYSGGAGLTSNKWEAQFDSVSPGPHLFLLYDGGSHALLAQDTLTIHAGSGPSATIDQSSLTSSSGNNLVVAGTAKGTTAVVLKVTDEDGVIMWHNDGLSGSVSSDGHWSTNLSHLGSGTYIVWVYKNINDETNSGISGGNFLTIGTLVVGG